MNRVIYRLTHLCRQAVSRPASQSVSQSVSQSIIQSVNFFFQGLWCVPGGGWCSCLWCTPWVILCSRTSLSSRSSADSEENAPRVKRARLARWPRTGRDTRQTRRTREAREMRIEPTVAAVAVATAAVVGQKKAQRLAARSPVSLKHIFFRGTSDLRPHPRKVGSGFD